MVAPDDLLSLKDAAKMLPSPRGGHGVHINTIKRWVHSGKLRHFRMGPYILVSKADVMAMLQEVPAKPPEPEPNHAAIKEAEMAVLRRHGLDKYCK